MADFKFLSESFPDSETVDIAKTYTNTFDYRRWDASNTEIIMCRVPWMPDYSHTVVFETKDERDKYFASLPQSERIVLSSPARIGIDGIVKLPIPFDRVLDYNYIWVTYNCADPVHRVDYAKNTTQKVGFFVVGEPVYVAPNTTAVTVEVDYWTSWLYDTKFRYARLERGHAPMLATDVDRFLENPLENNKYLLFSDFSVGEPAAKISRSSWYPIGDGRKYILFAVPVEAAEFESTDNVTTPCPGASDPVYGDIEDDELGKDAVMIYHIESAAHYDGLSLTYETVTNNGSTIYGATRCFAIQATDAPSFFAWLRSKKPQLFQLIESCYVVSDDMIRRTVSHSTPSGIDIWEVAACSESEVDFDLAKDMWGYPVEYRDMAKLYTYPYSCLEISTPQGQTATIRVESTGEDFKLVKRMSAVHPYLDMVAFVSGINSSGAINYTWTRVDGAVDTTSLPSGDFGTFLTHFQIPTFALKWDAFESASMSSYNSTVASINADIMNWKQARRAGNQDQKYTTADRDMVYEQALQNQDRASAKIDLNNYYERVNYDNDCALRAWQLQYRQAYGAATMWSQMWRSAMQSKWATDYAYAQQALDIGQARANIPLALTRSITNTVINSAASLVGASVGGALGSGVRAVGAKVGSSAAQTPVEAEQASAPAEPAKFSQAELSAARVKASLSDSDTAYGIRKEYGLLASAEPAEATKAVEHTPQVAQPSRVPVAIATELSAAVETTAATAATIPTLQVAQSWNSYEIENSAQWGCRKMAQAVTNTKDNAQNTNESTDFIRQKEVINQAELNDRANEVALVNLKNSQWETRQLWDGDVAIANEQRENTKALAEEVQAKNYEMSVANAKEAKTRNVKNMNAQLKDLKLSGPLRIGSDANGADDVLHQKGVMLKIKTQTPGQIAAAGDYFARYGYACPIEWDVKTFADLTPARKCYWQFADLWLEGVPNTAREMLTRILESGTTCWTVETIGDF